MSFIGLFFEQKDDFIIRGEMVLEQTSHFMDFLKDIIELVQPGKMRWKTTDFKNPKEWAPRGRGLKN